MPVSEDLPPGAQGRARTIAALAGEGAIRLPCLSEAVWYRRFDRHEVKEF